MNIHISTELVHQDVNDMLKSWFTNSENEDHAGYLLVTFDKREKITDNDGVEKFVTRFDMQGDEQFLRKAVFCAEKTLSRILAERKRRNPFSSL